MHSGSFSQRCTPRRFILAEESPFFEAKFRSTEFAQSNGIVDLSELDGHILQVAESIHELYRSVTLISTMPLVHLCYHYCQCRPHQHRMVAPHADNARVLHVSIVSSLNVIESLTPAGAGCRRRWWARCSQRIWRCLQTRCGTCCTQPTCCRCRCLRLPTPAALLFRNADWAACVSAVFHACFRTSALDVS